MFREFFRGLVNARINDLTLMQRELHRQSQNKKHLKHSSNTPQLTAPARRPFGGRGQQAKRDMGAPVPRRSGIKLLLHFFSKKWQVQGSALPPPA